MPECWESCYRPYLEHSSSWRKLNKMVNPKNKIACSLAVGKTLGLFWFNSFLNPKIFRKNYRNKSKNPNFRELLLQEAYKIRLCTKYNVFWPMVLIQQQLKLLQRKNILYSFEAGGIPFPLWHFYRQALYWQLLLLQKSGIHPRSGQTRSSFTPTVGETTEQQQLSRLCWYGCCPNGAATVLINPEAVQAVLHLNCVTLQDYSK